MSKKAAPKVVQHTSLTPAKVATVGKTTAVGKSYKYVPPKPPSLPKIMPKYFMGPKGVSLPDNQPHLVRLMTMFTYKRPYLQGNGTGYKEFTREFIMPVALEHSHWVDGIGNVFIDTRTDPQHRTMFTAHTDSVHYVEGRQHVKFDMKTGNITVLDGSCLGSDDASGVAMLLHLIESGVPALYAFFVGEECGGVGSKFATDDSPNLYTDIDRAIAFDRKADWSVITHQGWGRCCSDEFAEALSEALSNDTLMYAPDDGGVYTDTAEFVGLVAECTNLSIGYNFEHTQHEVQNLYHFQELARVCATLDWDALPVVREPGDNDDAGFDWGAFDKKYKLGTWKEADTASEEKRMAVEEALLMDELEVAVEDAENGDTADLMWLMALEVTTQPATLDMVRLTQRGINEANITPAMLRDCLDDAYTFGVGPALCRLYSALVSVPSVH